MIRRQIARDGGLLCPQRHDAGTSDATAEVIRQPLLWIDAICIDQGNVTEKNHQVQRMGVIYAGVKMVMIWLGRNGAHGAIDVMVRWYKHESDNPVPGLNWPIDQDVAESFSNLSYW